MNPISQLHREAMESVDAALAERRAGNHIAARNHFITALEQERQAAEATLTQPSRSILFRSAAWLSLEAEDAAEAERLAACGLADRNVPDRIKSELRAVAEESRLRLYRPLPPPTAMPSISLHLEGPAVGFGGANPADIEPRVAATRNMLMRTAERQEKMAFRRQSPPPVALTQRLQPRVSYASASVVVQVSLGGAQMSLWDANDNVVRDIRRSLEAFGEGGEAALVPLIPEELYRKNFASLATLIAPDGARITSVDVLSTTAQGQLPVVRLRQRPPMSEPRKTKSHQTVRLVGELRGADETIATNKIKILTDEGVQSIQVREIAMEDLVRPFYGIRVAITARERAGRGLELVGMPEVVGD